MARTACNRPSSTAPRARGRAGVETIEAVRKALLHDADLWERMADYEDAVNAGFRVVLPTDALCSVSDQTHEALLTLYRERFSTQIEATTMHDVMSRWDCR